MSLEIQINLVDHSHQPIEDAIVLIEKGDFKFKEIAAITDENGDAFLDIEAYGQYTIRVMINENSKSLDIQITPHKTRFNLLWK